MRRSTTLMVRPFVLRHRTFRCRPPISSKTSSCRRRTGLLKPSGGACRVSRRSSPDLCRRPHLERHHAQTDGREVGHDIESKGSSMYENLLANVPTDLWIGGKWRKASDGGRFDVIDPATERKIASVASATVDDAKAALDAAEGAFEGWAGRKAARARRDPAQSLRADHAGRRTFRKTDHARERQSPVGSRAARWPMRPNSSAGMPRKRCAISARYRVRRHQARESLCTTSRPVSPCW